MTDYGPLGIVWFDMPGGLTQEQTKALVDSLHQLQPGCLFSSRVGHGLGDYEDFGDSEIPVVPVKEAWEAIFTDNDTWGYIAKDKNFKSSTDLIRLLATVASKGGNLMLNVGPDGKGDFPPYEIKYLLKTGEWLDKYGESIYGTTYGIIPPQPWGVTTSKEDTLYLHIFQSPADKILYVPYFTASIKGIKLLGTNQVLAWEKTSDGVLIHLPALLPDSRDAVIRINFTGSQPDRATNHTQTVSREFPEITMPVIQATYKGRAENKTITSSHYFGDWKHDNCAVNMKDTADAITFDLDIRQPGDYRIVLDYACSHASAGEEGIVQVADQQLYFRSLETGEYNSHKPLMFIQHKTGLVTIPAKGSYKLTVRPAGDKGHELFWLRNVIIKPIE